MIKEYNFKSIDVVEVSTASLHRYSTTYNLVDLRTKRDELNTLITELENQLGYVAPDEPDMSGGGHFE